MLFPFLCLQVFEADEGPWPVLGCAAGSSGCGAWLGPAMDPGAKGGNWPELVLLLGGKFTGGGGTT